MYITSLPDHKAPGFDEAAYFSKFRKHNIIVHAASNSSHCDAHTGCLSVKTLLYGEEWYGIGNRRLALRPGQYLVLNDEQEYSCHSDEKVNCLSVFFKKEFASAVLQDLLSTEAQSLEGPPFHSSTPPSFFQTINPVTSDLHTSLSSLIAILRQHQHNEAATDEHLIFLLRYLLRIHHSDIRRVEQVNAMKASTRQALYTRVCAARDVLHSSFTENLDLNRLAQLSSLSVPQLVRQFRAAFKCTPYQYLIGIRLQHAADLLQSTRKPVSEITWLCGFEDSSAFCRAFKSAYGMQPLSYRNIFA